MEISFFDDIFNFFYTSLDLIIQSRIPILSLDYQIQSCAK
ncbi:hypothetical protein BN938_1892 [Mucinivorans hirudinis]|uniref:Uncharacterized protein n=1 Tax=Mucinivorans hirudinis TaxID=1433126 RepID=A0A060R8X9_9BACT|nr:hypothetical protein BN938_1892 [Mucinivorans hirudinis]